MRRWLVAVALAVVVMPEVAGADALRVDLSTRKVTSTASAIRPPLALPNPALPANVSIGLDGVTIRANGQTFRHTLGDLWWSAAVGDNLVLGVAAMPGGHADRIVGIDHTTGRVQWRRKVDSLVSAPLADELLAVERAGALDIIDVRTGKTLGTTPLRGQGLQEISRGRTDVHVKTNSDLIAIDRTTGAVKWTQATTSRGNIAMTATTVVDGWVDRTAHKFGVVTYDPMTGKRLEAIELGSTGGWYDYERVELVPDGAGEVLVSSVFGVE